MPNPTFDNSNVLSWMQNASSTDWRALASDANSNGIKPAMQNLFTVSATMQTAMDAANNDDPTGKLRFVTDCYDVADRIDAGWTMRFSTDIYDTGTTPWVEQAFYLVLDFARTWGGLLLIRSAKIVSRSS